MKIAGIKTPHVGQFPNSLFLRIHTNSGTVGRGGKLLRAAANHCFTSGVYMIKQAALMCLCIFVLYSDARSQEDAADGLPPVSTEEIYVRGQHLSYDPFFVLPNQRGYKAVNVGMRSTDTSEPDKRTNFFLMAKFTPSEGVEVGTQLEFGFLNETASNFSSLMVGSKYSLGAQRAASINLLMPAGDIKIPVFLLD